MTKISPTYQLERLVEEIRAKATAMSLLEMPMDFMIIGDEMVRPPYEPSQAVKDAFELAHEIDLKIEDWRRERSSAAMEKVFCCHCGEITNNRVVRDSDCWMWYCTICDAQTDTQFIDE